MARSWRLAVSVACVLGLFGSPLISGPAFGSASAAVVEIDCTSLRWTVQPNGWVEVVGDADVTGTVTGLAIDTPVAEQVGSTEIASGATNRSFFARYALFPNLPASLTLRATYVANGRQQASNSCHLDDLARMNDIRPTFVSGLDRYATAVAVAQKSHPESAPAVFVASGETFPDALSAGPAAAHLGAPLLLTRSAVLPKIVSDEISTLSPKVIYVVGGDGAVSSDVYAALARLAPEIYRLSGPDRYSTSRAVASGIFSGAGSAFIASGADYPDALSATAAAAVVDAPLLLVPADQRPDVVNETVDAISALHAQSTVIVGGPGAVPAATEKIISATVPTKRIGGADRYATSLSVNENFFGPTVTTAYLAVGTNFPDALSGSTLAAATGSPLMITKDICVPDGELIAIARWGVETVNIIGGTPETRSELAWLRSCLEVGFFASHSW